MVFPEVLHGSQNRDAKQHSFFLHHSVFTLRKELNEIKYCGFHLELSEPLILQKDLSPENQLK